MAINKVFLIGNLTKDPEMSETSNGISLCRFSIAVNRGYKDSDGNTPTDFFIITVWREKAENCGKYLKKGSKVAIVGNLQNRTYEDKDGNKRIVTDIIANEVEFLTKPSENKESDRQQPTQNRQSSRATQSSFEIDEDDLPF